MNKVLMLKLVNTLLGVSFIIQAVTGAMMKYALATDYMMQITETHSLNGSILFLLVVAHLGLNWAWVKMTFFKKKTEPAKL